MTPIFSEDEELSNELDLSEKSEAEKVKDLAQKTIATAKAMKTPTVVKEGTDVQEVQVNRNIFDHMYDKISEL